ncbi:AAA family ATPase [Planomonospora sp. ID67723]|uniref:HelD family protein n=1 Tax=Planomonospora sp. ID67723 TaxID=2738134 RepID=UPI0018C3CFEF|nr:ATP-binding domain-containing protein [Planomonospora sp. ID67723]MBG0831899.1 AAA family ATPase [Planomonospora sp. ID67723]
MALRQPGTAGPATALTEAIRVEQTRLTHLYGRLDILREQARSSLAAVLAAGQAGGPHQARIERDVSAAGHSRRLARLSGVEHGLCFGRIDETGGQTHYIGRTGLRDDDGEIILTDWRAPAARPFYTASPGDPGPLARRRHLRTHGRAVVGVDDEVFDLDRLSERDRRGLVGEAALMAALRRGRTGRMGEVVATIQTEQDRVIRSGLAGALVVHGGPGTGKTVAALHRAAYLLYTHREVLQRRGVLVVGPTTLFSRYIAQVLPSLGETDVVVATLGELYPGVRATAADSPAAAAVKGDLRMVEVVAAAVRDRQRLPAGDLQVTIPVRTSLRDGVEVVVEEMTISAPQAACAAARDRARRSGLPHNTARRLFVLDVLTALAADEAARLDALVALPAEEAARLEALLAEDEEDLRPEEPRDADDLRYAGKVLWAHPAVREAIEQLWPYLTPERLVGEFLADPAAIASAAPQFSPAERQALLRPYGSPWTPGDVPLLDEAAELLGADIAEERAAREAEAERWRQEEAYARGVLEFTGLAEEEVMEAGMLAGRHHDPGPETTTAQRAAADRTWAYGHVIVDEAQELSAMAWRTVMRRIPARSLTVVGDLAQTGSAAGARSWGEMLDPYLEGRWREERLTVNYRTPAEIMTLAADVLAAVAPEQEAPGPVREGGDPPRAVRLDAGAKGGVTGLPALVEAELAVVRASLGEAESAARPASAEPEDGDGRASPPPEGTGAAPEAAHVAGGRLAVIVPDARHAEVAALFPHTAADVLDRPVAVLTPAAAKGLEFDAVVVVEPAEILAQGPMGGRDLYVAVTRATRRLTVAHTGALPDMLSRLERH